MDSQLIAKLVMDDAIARGVHNFNKMGRAGKLQQRSRSGLSTAMESTVCPSMSGSWPERSSSSLSMPEIAEEEHDFQIDGQLSLVSIVGPNSAGPCLMTQKPKMPALSANPKLEDYTELLMRVHEGTKQEDFATEPSNKAMMDFKVKCFNYGKSLIKTGESMLEVIPNDDAARASASTISAEKSPTTFWKDVDTLIDVSGELREDISNIAFDLQDLRRWVHFKLDEIEKQTKEMKSTSKASKFGRSGRVSSPRSKPQLRRGVDYSGRHLNRPLRARTPPPTRISII